MIWFLTCILLLFYNASSVLSLTENEQNNIFEQFIENNMENYLEWLRENNFDPSPVGQWEDDLSIESINYKLTCKIRDEQVRGIASPSNQLYVEQVNAQLSTRMFSIHFNTRGGISFEGKHNANGTTGRGVEINGQGNWTYITDSGIDELTKYKFEISSAGYLNISAGPFDHSVYPINNKNDSIYFENLWDDGVDGLDWLIEENLLSKFRLRLLDWKTMQPTRVLVHQYLTQVFQATKLDDILGTKPQHNSCLPSYKLNHGFNGIFVLLVYLLA